MYEYPCTLIRVINGNTIEADIDLGFNIKIKQRIRLYGIDSNDTNNSKTILINTLPKNFIVKTIYSKRSKVGRVLGILYLEDETGNLININELLIEKGLVKKFDI